MHSGLIQPGRLIAGRYRLEESIGVGGHAYVFRASQEGLERKVAVKILKSGPALNDDTLSPEQIDTLIKRFEQEARMIAQLRDPGTITMYEHGTTPDGLLYMVVEYIEGESLKDFLESHGAMEPKQAVKILEQLLYSVQEAHALGVLHRDIKPDNIMIFTHLGRRDQVKLLDFGIAKMVGSEQDDLTAEGSIVGTPRYIAPERIKGQAITPSSDLYSLGLVAYEMLTGERVMADKHGIRALQAQMSDPSVELPEQLAIPARLRHVINTLMKKDPTQRYALASHVIEQLEGWDREPQPGTQRLPHSPAPHSPLPPDRTEQLSTLLRETRKAQEEPEATPPPLIDASSPLFSTAKPAPQVVLAQQPGKKKNITPLVLVAGFIVMLVIVLVSTVIFLLMRSL